MLNQQYSCHIVQTMIKLHRLLTMVIVIVRGISALLATSRLQQSSRIFSSGPSHFQGRSVSERHAGTRRCLSSQNPVSNAEASIPANVTTTRPYFRVYYNDVYEVILPPKHRFPMQKYAQVRTLFQKWVSDLSPEERAKVDCGTFHGRLDSVEMRVANVVDEDPQYVAYTIQPPFPVCRILGFSIGDGRRTRDNTLSRIYSTIFQRRTNRKGNTKRRLSLESTGSRTSF